MVSELSETEILDYLMTSDFEEGLTSEEFKFLLLKFRHYYKKVYCGYTTEKDKIDSIRRNSEESQKIFEHRLQDSINQKKELENKFSEVINRKLSFKERFIGKIILNDENK